MSAHAWRALLQALYAAFGVEPGDQHLRGLIGAIRVDVATYSSTGLLVRARPPRCAANRHAAISAQAGCEAQAGCDMDEETDLAAVPVICEGEFACRMAFMGAIDGDFGDESAFATAPFRVVLDEIERLSDTGPLWQYSCIECERSGLRAALVMLEETLNTFSYVRFQQVELVEAIRAGFR